MSGSARICAILAVVATLAVTPAIARGPNDGYVACSDTDNCVPFDVTSYAVESPIDLLPEGNLPHDATMSPDGSEVWMCGASGDGVVVLNVATNTVTHRIGVGDYPTSICFTDDGRLVLVSSRNDDNIALIDAATYRRTGTLGVATGVGGNTDGPGHLALDPVSEKIYAVDWYGPTLYEIARDASAVLRSVSIGEALWGIVVDPLGRYIYVTDRGTDEVRVIDQATLTEITTIGVSDDPWGIDVTINGAKLIVPCEDDANVFIINTHDWSFVARPLQYGAAPRDVDILDSEDRAFIAGGRLASGESYVYVLNLVTNQVIAQLLTTGTNANAIAVQGQTTSSATGVSEAEPVSALQLACHPNPFGPGTSVSYSVPEALPVTLAVYDAAGRRVAALEAGERPAGDHTVTWDGRSDDGQAVSAGVYFVRLVAGHEATTIKAVLLK